MYLFGTRFRWFSSITFNFQSLNSYWSKMIQRLSMSITRCQYNMLILMGSLRLPKIFLRANSKVMFLASWVTSQSLFPIVYSYFCHWECSWICSNWRIYLCVFCSLWLNKHWPANKKRYLDSFQLRAWSFNSCSERSWLCQHISSISIS